MSSFYCQNELFQKEVREVLGDEFLEHNRQIRNDGARSAGTGVGAPHSRRNSRNGGGAGDEAAPDLGILKALSSMGTAAKRNLSQLAERFQSGGGGGNGVGGGNDHGDRSATAREFKPLVDSGGNSYEVRQL